MGVIRLQIPTTVSPRYAPADEDPVAIDTITPPYAVDVPYMFSIKIRVLATYVKCIESPSHDIQIVTDDKYTLIQSDKLRLDQDFILEITTINDKKPFCLVSCHDNGEKALLMRFSPELNEYIQPKDKKAEVIFIIDCSGSMHGSSITEAKQALELSLRSMSQGDLFNVVRFGSTYEMFKRESAQYNSSSLRQAFSYIESMGADLGGTELKAPIDYVCKLNGRKDVTRDVIVLTDGQVSNTDLIIQKVASLRGKVRFFTLGIGYGASHHLVKGIARASGGACEMIQPGEKIQPKVLRQFSRIGQPSLEDVKFTVKNGKTGIQRCLPPLFDGDGYTLFARVIEINDNSTVQFSATCDGENYIWDAPVVNMEDDNTIPALWALSQIKNLKETIESGNVEDGSRQLGRKMKIMEKEITELGLKYNILTDYTSFVAVEEREENDKEYSASDYRRVPVLMTRDLFYNASKKRLDAYRANLNNISYCFNRVNSRNKGVAHCLSSKKEISQKSKGKSVSNYLTFSPMRIFHKIKRFEEKSYEIEDKLISKHNKITSYRKLRKDELNENKDEHVIRNKKGKTRISVLAKELGINSNLLVDKCQEKGFSKIHHHANYLDYQEVELIRKEYGIENPRHRIQRSMEKCSISPISSQPKARVAVTGKWYIIL